MKNTTLLLLGAAGLSTVAIAQTTPQTVPANNSTNSTEMTTETPAPTQTPAPTETPTTTEQTTTTPDESLANETAPPPNAS